MFSPDSNDTVYDYICVYQRLGNGENYKVIKLLRVYSNTSE